jgi:GAF domain-containing protein
MQYVIDTLYHALLVPRFRYPDGLSQVRARATLAFSLLMMVSSAFGLLGLLLQSTRSELSNIVFVGSTAALLGQFAVLGLVHAGAIQAAMAVFFVSALGSAVGLYLEGASTLYLLVFALPLLYASLCWFLRGALLTTLFEIVLVVAVDRLQANGMFVVANRAASERLSLQTLLMVVAILAIGSASGIFSYELRRAMQHVNRLLIRLRATAEVATQATTNVTGLNDLLKRTVNYIRDRFALYHVHLFLADKEHRFVSLVASTSEVGDVLLQRGYRLAISSQNAIGQTMMSGEPVTAAVGENSDLPQPVNELSRNVRSELALPLIVGDEIIGVIDVQSVRPNAFAQEDIDSLLIIATHVSIAIHNAQLFEEQRSALNENRRLFLDAELNLREIQRLNQRLTGEAWDEYLKAHHAEAVGYTLSNNQLRSDTTWTPLLQQAVSKRRAAISKEGERQVVAVPVELRGRAIGAIEVEMSENVRQSDALDMLQAVAQRLALSIDNARLFEQAQELAQQELEVNAISTKMQGVTKIDEIVLTAIDELGRALGAEAASIRLAVAEREHTGHGTGNGTRGPNGHDANTNQGMQA